MSDDIGSLFHQEATFEAGTQVQVAGLVWRVIVREGATTGTIDQGWALMHHVARLAGDQPPQQSVRVPGLVATPVQAVEQPDPDSRNTEQSSDVKVERVSRLVISGNLDRPLVEMFSSNPALKWPFVKTPTTLVQKMLTDRYGEGSFTEAQLAKLGQCGATIPVEWDIEWRPSPKDSKWKDLVGVTIVKKGG